MIAFARRIRGLAGPIAALLAVALATASASAAAANYVAISGPRHVQAGQKVKLQFTGHASSSVHRLRVWLDNRRCASSAKAEATRTDLQSPTNFHVSGDFRALLTIRHSAPGTHVTCAYLVVSRTQGTAARASWRYVTR